MKEFYTVLAEYHDAIYRPRAEKIKGEIDFIEELFQNEAGREVTRVLDLA